MNSWVFWFCTISVVLCGAIEMYAVTEPLWTGCETEKRAMVQPGRIPMSTWMRVCKHQ
jgi:hypothetical protein